MSKGLRKGQLIGIHGPGAIADIGNESFVVTSIDQWRRDGMVPCNLVRLSDRLQVARLLQPATGDNRFAAESRSVALHRFPRWMFCQKCRFMTKWRAQDEASLKPGTAPDCKRCSGSPALVPMRFVQICENGHLDDVDWLWWVHATPDAGPRQCQDPSRLRFVSRTGMGSGLNSLQVRCEDCAASRSLGDLHRQGGWKCKSSESFSGGRQPWQHPASGELCDAEPMVVQRGDSNVYFPSVVSAIDIPSSVKSGSHEEDALIKDRKDFKTLKSMWESLQNKKGIDPADVMNEAIARLSEETEVDAQHIVRLLNDDGEAAGIEPKRSLSELLPEMKAEEYVALAQPDAVESNQFSGTNYTPAKEHFGEAMCTIIKSISLITRLREVRALRGFHRVRPGGDEQLVPASLSNRTDWLPACEVFGEGIFLEFNRPTIESWEEKLPATERSRLESLQQRINDQNLGFLPKVTPRLIAIHGLSHLLMRQLCFESGYASSSLRERMYLDDGMAGVLIYTADGDSEGTLGGLVRQGHPDRLPAALARALTAASWCSGDPLCAEGENQGMAGLNRAACHACLLVSETSCECANALLDRRFLIGDSGNMEGLFSAVLSEYGVA